MVWEFQCPADGCEYATRENDELDVIENARQHMRDTHGGNSTREEVEQYVVGPG